MFGCERKCNQQKKMSQRVLLNSTKKKSYKYTKLYSKKVLRVFPIKIKDISSMRHYVFPQ